MTDASQTITPVPPPSGSPETGFDDEVDLVAETLTLGVTGRVASISGLTIEATDVSLPLGSLCRIGRDHSPGLIAEVIGFRNDRTLLIPLSDTSGIIRGDPVTNLASATRVWCSDALLGRVINGLGEPIDGGPPLPRCSPRPIDAAAASPMHRMPIRQAISTGVRAIDALHTCGLGQRMGVFSGPGVGKSRLLASIARNTSADVSVVGLIGERGREVQEFIEHGLGPDGLRRCVVVVATGDEAPMLRVRAAKVACTISEYFRDRKMHVLLLLDSLTRLCHAQRQIGLAAHEPPATRGYPPSVFAMLPQILERAGRTPNGSITGFYSVLVEGDDFTEPVPDAVKGISDGHLWLSRSLANRGHFPAIDPLQSISRLRDDVAPAEQVRRATQILRLSGVYADIEDLVNIGAYVPGASLEYDMAVQARPKIVEFLRQGTSESSPPEVTARCLDELSKWLDATEASLRSDPARQNRGGSRTQALRPEVGRK